MANKSSGNKKSTKKSVVVNESFLINISAYVALAIAAVLFLIGVILNSVGLGNVTSIMNLIKDIAIGVALGLAGYRFTRGKHIAIKVLYWIAICLYIACAIAGMTFGI